MGTQEKIEWPIKIRSGSVTVKIYHTPTRGNDGFTMAYHEGGLRVRRMFAKLAKARGEAKAVADRINSGRGLALEITGKDRDAYLYAISKLKPLQIPLNSAIDQFVIASSTGAPLVESCKFWIKHHATSLPSKSVKEVYQELLIAKKSDGCSDRYLSDLKSRVGRFADAFSTNIVDVTTSDLDAWLRRLKLEGRTRNNYRNAILALFSFAKASGYLSREQTTAAEHTTLARKKTEAIEVFTPEEFSNLLNSANRTALPFFVLGGFCGLRTQEILRLTWSDVLWAESAIEIRADVAKTRVRRLAPLNSSAIAWLTSFKTARGMVIQVKNHGYHVDLACKAAGVTWKSNALRHSYISYAMAITKDAVRVAHECGNSPAIVRSNYDRVVTEGKGKAWFAIMPETAKNVLQMKGAM